MRKYKMSIVFLFCLLILSSCSFKNDKDLEILEYIDNSADEERKYLVDKNATELFKDIFYLKNMTGNKAYIINKKLVFEFEFLESITPKEVRSLSDFYSKIAFDREMILGSFPYIQTMGRRQKNNIIELRIFVKDKLLQYKSFNYLTNESDYYENMKINVDRKYKKDFMKTFINRLEDVSPVIKKVDIIKPYKGYVVYFKFDNSRNLKKESINKIKKIIEKDIATILENKAIEIYGMNTNSLGIVLELYDTNDKKNLVYFNGEDKKWIDVDWQKYDFFFENNR